jgi:hypothetical protein
LSKSLAVNPHVRTKLKSRKTQCYQPRETRKMATKPKKDFSFKKAILSFSIA